METRKGVAFSTDMAVAIFIFLALFVSIITAWNSVLDTSNQNIQRKHAEITVMRIADEFVRSGGYPLHWEGNPSSALTIGLAGSDRTLDGSKVQAFLDMDYDTAKDVLKTEGYDFRFILVGNGSVKGPVPDADNIFFTRRIVVMNGTNETLELYLWRS